MNILFVLYGDFTSNSANPVALYAQLLHERGHRCCVAVASNLESVRHCSDPAFRAMLFANVLASPETAFADGRPADVVHAWTPREVVRRFVTAYMATRPTPLMMYLEDHESWITSQILGLADDELARQTDEELAHRVPESLSHPFRHRDFVGLADCAVVIQDKLRTEVPPWVQCHTVLPPVDLDLFSPRPANPLLRTNLGVEENERIIVYPGGLNSLTRPAIRTLCDAVGLINARGVRCRLLRTGPFALDFLDEMPRQLAWTVTDLGVIDRRALPELLSLADAFVQPGRIDPFEDLRLPGKLPELLAMGRPVVMPDVNIAHMFTDGVDAVLTRTGTAEEIALRCLELFSDPARARRIGEAGRRFAERNFEPTAKVERMIGIYESVCEDFDPAVASEVWSQDATTLPVATLLARKLRLLVRSAKHGASDVAISNLFTEHARYVESMQSRLRSLEGRTVERDVKVAELVDAVGVAQRSTVELERALQARESRIDALVGALVEQRDKTHRIITSLSWRMTRPWRFLQSLLAGDITDEDARAPEATPFDAVWYLERYPDVAASGIDPYQHYVIFGKAEGRMPRAGAATSNPTR